MATDLPSLSGRSASNVFGAAPTDGRASRVCREGATSAGEEGAGLRNSDRGLRETAGGMVGRVVGSMAFSPPSLIFLRTSPVLGARMPVGESLGFGAISDARNSDDAVRAVPRLAGAKTVFLSASARANRKTSELTSVS